MSQVYNAREVIDAFGKYNPTIQCECIDNRTLTNINHSLKILYNDKMREQKELEKDIDRLSQLEHDAMNINKLVMTRTESLIEVLKDIKPCKEKWLDIKPYKEKWLDIKPCKEKWLDMKPLGKTKVTYVKEIISTKYL